MLNLISQIVGAFPQAHEILSQILIDSLITSSKIDDHAAQLANNLLHRLAEDKAVR